MIEWWNSLSSFMQVLWSITLTATLIFLIETIVTFLGLGGADMDSGMGGDMDFGGADGSFEADPSMGLLTFRNFVNFFLGFGWTAILLHDKIGSGFLLMVIAVVVGIVLVAAVMQLFKWLYSMQQSGNIDIFASGVGCEGTCYLRIPAARSGFGKVQICVNNAIREFEALTDGDEIKTGEPIRVVEVVNERTLLVEPMIPTIV